MQLFALQHCGLLFASDCSRSGASACVLLWFRLDYPGIGPEHSFLKDVGRAEYFAVTDEEALEAFQRISQLEGIIPALETSHALAHLEVGLSTLCYEWAVQSTHMTDNWW